ncbi:uncharacterized protein LOC108099309 [Drosophila ficusphila]|uniref:uncharacterized protein LOC108099309 n=1 Tax=Drosophila ficusphila TaxID=30025 RepID=UPI0007E5F251|nr:uncharacterized protein LOC108099309 [Drosophila ficusphila]
MKTSLLLAFLMTMLGVTLGLVLANSDDGYQYGQPSGEQLQEIQAVSLPRKRHPKPRVYPEDPSQGCGTAEQVDHGAALATYHSNRPQPRRLYKHQELEVDNSFFEPSSERIHELKRILLDQL